nr:hypothetical protein [Mycoplasmopsis bovis]
MSLEQERKKNKVNKGIGWGENHRWGKDDEEGKVVNRTRYRS